MEELRFKRIPIVGAPLESAPNEIDGNRMVDGIVASAQEGIQGDAARCARKAVAEVAAKAFHASMPAFEAFDGFGFIVTATAKDGYYLTRTPAWVHTPDMPARLLEKAAASYDELALAAQTAALKAQALADRYRAQANHQDVAELIGLPKQRD